MALLKKENGKYVCISDEFVPVPHSLTRVIKESGNYGLADAAREQFPELVLKEGETPGPVRRKESNDAAASSSAAVGIGRGRGRGRILQKLEASKPSAMSASSSEAPLQFQTSSNDNDTGDKSAATASAYKMFSSGIRDDFSDERDDVVNKDSKEDSWREFLVVEAKNIEKPDERRDQQTARDDAKDDDMNCYVFKEPENIKTAPRNPIPTSLFKAGKAKGSGKTNGYCLFLKHMGKKCGVTGSINELMRKFDKDWKMLPEDEKKAWKTCAKTGDLPPFATGRGNRDGERPTRRFSSASSISTATSTTMTSTRGGSLEESEEPARPKPAIFIL